MREEYDLLAMEIEKPLLDFYQVYFIIRDIMSHYQGRNMIASHATS